MFVNTMTMFAFIAIASALFVLGDIIGRKWAEAKGIELDEAGEDFGEE